MKICVCGKGGCGKSTIVSLLTHGFRKKGKDVIVLDSDESNTSLYWMLGLDHPPVALMEMVGGKKAVQKKMIARFSAGDKEAEMSIWQMDDITSQTIPTDFIVKKDGYHLVSTGKINQSLEGCACPMGTITREFLKKLKLSDNEIAVVDMEAGIEHFGRGIEKNIDCVVCVIEPSFESISLGKKVMELTQSSGASFKGAILNKLNSNDQKNSVLEKTQSMGIPVIGSLMFQSEIQNACLEQKALHDAYPEIETIISKILG